MIVGRKQAGVLPFWPDVLRELTGFDDKSHPKVGCGAGRARPGGLGLGATSLECLGWGGSSLGASATARSQPLLAPALLARGV